MTTTKGTGKHHILVSLFTFAVMLSSFGANGSEGTDIVYNAIKGAGYKDTSDLNGLPYLSLAGGAPILLSGLQFASDTSYNAWKFEPLWLEGAEIWGPLMTSDDEMNSNALAGRLALVAPSVTSLMAQDITMFNGAFLPSGWAVDPELGNQLQFRIKIYNQEDIWTVECANTNKCAYYYSRDYTPVLLDITPPNVCQGQEMHFHMNARGAHTTAVTPSDETPYRSLHMGQYLLDVEDIIEETDRLAAWQHDTQYVVMTDGSSQNSTDPKILFYNGLAMLMRGATHCNFANTDCWTVRVHPRIKTVSWNTGYTTGSQELKITGVSLNGTTSVEVEVAGVNCTVTASDLDYITCVTGASSVVSPIGYQPGQPGMTQIQTDEDYQEYLVLASTFEVMNLNSSQPLSGWFRAPANGTYRFYVACDAACSLDMNATVPFNSSAVNTTQPGMTTIASRTSKSSWREYHYQTDDGHYSSWLTLNESMQYYFSGSTSSQMSVGVEIKPDNATGTAPHAAHPYASKSMQQVAFEHTTVPEIWDFTVTNPDNGTFVLNFVNTKTTPISFYTTTTIEANATAAEVRSAINGFYGSVHGCTVTVTRVSYDVSGAVTTDYTLITSHLYTVSVDKQMLSFSSSGVQAAPTADADKNTTATAATIVVTPPLRGQQSSPGFNGTFVVTCTDNVNAQFTSVEIDFAASAKTIEYKLQSIPMLVDNIEVFTDDRFPYRENGISFIIHFTGIDYEVPLCTIKPSSGEYPLTGGDNQVQNSAVIRPFAESLFFEVVPMEMLNTDEQTPQILVKIDGMDALCLDMNCDFTYTASTATIETQTLSDSSVLTLGGDNLPNAATDKIWFGPIGCTQTSNSNTTTTYQLNDTCTQTNVTNTNGTVTVNETCTPNNITNSTITQITCQLNDTRVSGQWISQIMTVYGLTPNTISTTIDIPVSVSTITPASDVNYLGGDYMKIVGDSFGYQIDKIAVTYTDGTICDVIDVQMTFIICINRRFTSTVASTQYVTVSVNGLTDSTLTVAMLSQAEQSMSMSPTSASPVLKTELTVYLASSYPDTLNKTDFNCTLLSHNDTSYSRMLYIMAADDAAKTLTIKFPGAVSGNYYLQISAAQHGRIDSDLLQLHVHGSITSVSPLTGSKYGGALVTITGENFSNDPLDNPVKIGDNYCYVITTSTTQITCRTDLLSANTVGDQLVLVFLKTSEEAATPNDDDINFTYANPSAEVTDIQVEFDSTQFKHRVVVTGTGFDSSIELLVDGFQQTLESQTATTAYFTLSAMSTASTSNVVVYTSEGYPEGAEITHSLDVDPALMAIDPAIGNAGGTKIKVTGSGFGTSTVGLNLKANGVDICSSVEIIEFGKFYCYTITGDIELANSTTLFISKNGTVNETSYYTASDVIFSQVETISVSSVSVSGSSITFTGSGFLADHTATAKVGGVSADTVTVNSANEVVAQWSTTGIPASTKMPELHFVHTDGYGYYAKFKDDLTFEKVQTVVSSTSALECSFAGGCTYTIESEGLYATLLDSANSIKVCGSTCAIKTDLSDQTNAVCELDKLATTYSVDNYKINESVDLNETIFPTGSEILHDGLTVDSYETDISSNCEFGMTFKEGHVAVLDEAKVFIGFLTDKTPYVNNLEFHGSDDNWATFTLLHTYSDEIHEGWNYIDYRDDGVSKPSYNSYRFQGKVQGSCRITEFKLHGVQAIADENASYSCTPKIYLGSDELTTSVALNPISYAATKTPKLIAINPRFGSVLGSTTVTLTGENFSTNTAEIKFDNRTCTVQSATDTSIVCLTADKPYVPDTPVTVISVENMGLVATQNLVFRYVSLWSDAETWGGDIPPILGESVAIPAGQHLLVDVDSTDELNAIIVEGSMIFAPDADPNHLRTFDANFIMVHHGYFELGTEEFPYTSKMQITMHATRFSPSFGIYGNKMIGCRYCQLSMHGIPKTTTWTRLSVTADAGATTITVQGEPDWNVGDHIVIAGTTWHFNYDHEERVIASISGSTITLTEALVHKHISEAPSYGGVEIPMRAEVGLLTRNVVFRGNPADSKKDLFGAHIIVHSPGDESSIARIHYIELTEAGQAFKLGRYAIHFHMIGTVHGSLVKGNAVHHSYNRACTTHGVHYFKVEQNVAFDTMGHSFFIEDAVETKCVYDGNLSILTRASNSFLNTDQTPGAWWITNADNIFINNAVAGTDAYGFWFDMQKTAIGANYDPNICPEHQKLGEFRNNTSHGNRKYGLRIFHALVPRTYPCKAAPYDATYLDSGETTPYYKNPLIPAIFEDFVSYKTGRNGAITERTGNVIFRNFKMADHKICSVEFSALEGLHANDYAKLENSVIVGNTGLNDDDGILARSTIWGFIGPRQEYMVVDGVGFYEFANTGSLSGAIGTCSHCFHDNSADSGGRTVTFRNLTFDDATVPKRIYYQQPWREILHDEDGSLTGLGAGSWATFYYHHLNQSECTYDADKYDGVICDNSISLRRIAFHAATPASFKMQKIKVAKWETDFEAALKADSAALFEFEQDVDHTRWGRQIQREGPDPSWSWPIVVMTGQRYRVHWGEGIDFEKMSLDVSPLWKETEMIKIMTNFTDVRMSINMTDRTNTLILNETFTTKTEEELISGDNVIYNQTEVREFHYAINGKDYQRRSTLKMEGFRCLVDCHQEAVEEVDIMDTPIPWSVPSSWPSGLLPVEGEEAEIPPGAWIEFDLAETPLLKSLTINGRLSFKDDDTEGPTNRTIHAYWVYIRQGELKIGSADKPYSGVAEVRVYGNPENETIAPSLSTEFGNKGLFVLGLAEMYGKSRSQNSRLRQTALKGDNTIKVSPGLDWVQWDKIAIAATAMQNKDTEHRVIDSYDSATGIVTLTNALERYHWGHAVSTAEKYSGVDMRGEVILLTRNVRVVGNDTDSWGGQILVSDNLEFSGVQRSGQLIIDNVEVYNCSQRNTFKSAIRFENQNLKWQSVTNSVIHGSIAWGISAQFAANIYVDSTNVIGARAVGVNVFSSNNVTLNNLIVGDVIDRPEMEMTNTVDISACIAMCAYFGEDPACYGNTITNSIGFGCIYSGFVAPASDCDTAETQTKFRNNVAHSVAGTGAVIFPDVTGSDHRKCHEGSHFSAYKVQEQSVAGMFVTQEMRMTNIVSIDTQLGISLQTIGESERQISVLKDTDIYGETEAEDCPTDHDCYCEDKLGFMAFSSHLKSKEFMISSPSPLPMYMPDSYASWASDTYMRKITFSDFPSNKTACGRQQRVVGLSSKEPDMVPVQNFEYTTFHNVHQDALAFFLDPLPRWNNVDDCIGFPCTAPSNAVFSFKQSKFSGMPQPFIRDRHFQIVADTLGASDSFQNCEYVESWNAWGCKNKMIGQLVFIGDDPDWEDRNVAPVWLTKEETGYSNKLQHQMDHVWDGFYTGQLHKQQYTAMLEAEGNYTVEYTSTPFKKMRYHLRSDTGIIKLKVHYWNAGSYEVYADGRLIEPTPWDKKIGAASELTGYRGCGENRYVGVQNFLEFMMTPYCLIEIKPVDKILSNVRMDWTMEEFYAAGGVTSFADRVAGALGIHASQMKVVAVYTGSLVVDFEIKADDSSEDGAADLRSIETNLNTMVQEGDSSFGGPILSASTNGEAVVEDPTYNPAAAPAVTATPVVVEDNTKTLSISDEGLYINLSAPARNSLIGILVVLVLIVGGCFGCGTLVICFASITNASRQIVDVQKKHAKQQELKKNGQQNASESQIDIDHQYVMPVEPDMDIFTQKPRTLKVNQEEMANSKSGSSDSPDPSDSNRMSMDSATRMRPDESGQNLLNQKKQTLKTASKLKQLHKSSKRP